MKPREAPGRLEQSLIAAESTHPVGFGNIKAAPFVTLAAGMVGGLLGIGGGVVMGPMLLHMMHPQVIPAKLDNLSNPHIPFLSH